MCLLHRIGVLVDIIPAESTYTVTHVSLTISLHDVLVGVPAHFGLVTAALSTLPEGPSPPPHQLRPTSSTWSSACVSLFARAEPTDHPISRLHHVILGQVVTRVTGVGLPTAREPVQQYGIQQYDLLIRTENIVLIIEVSC